MIGKINILLNLGLTIFNEADSGGFATFEMLLRSGYMSGQNLMTFLSGSSFSEIYGSMCMGYCLFRCRAGNKMMNLDYLKPEPRIHPLKYS